MLAQETNQKTPFHLGLIAMYSIKTASSLSKSAKKNSEMEKNANYQATNHN